MLAILVAALLLVVLTPSPGSAHAYLQLSPAAGANLAQGPGHPPPFRERRRPPACCCWAWRSAWAARLRDASWPGSPDRPARRSGCSCSASPAAASSLPSSPRWLRSRWTWPGRARPGGRRRGPTTLRWGVREAGLVLLLVALSGRRGTVDRAPSRVAFLAGACPGRCRDRGTRSRGGGGPAGPAGGPGAAPCRRADLGGVRRLSRDRPAAAHRALPRPYVLAALRRFARPAVACLAVTAVTGVFLASDTIGSVDAALRTTYGRSFLLKLLLVVLASVWRWSTTTACATARRPGSRLGPWRSRAWSPS